MHLKKMHKCALRCVLVTKHKVDVHLYHFYRSNRGALTGKNDARVSFSFSLLGRRFSSEV